MDQRPFPRSCRLLLLGAVASLAACASGPVVHASFDSQVDFARYRTFGFATPLGTDPAGYESPISQDLKAATRRELEARGLVHDAAAPDLLVNFNASMSEKLRTVTSGPPAPVFGGAYSQYRTGMYAAWPASSTETEVPYTEGTINIDMVDRVSRQRVWEGTAVGVVTANSTATMRPGIDATVANILAKFPVVARR